MKKLDSISIFFPAYNDQFTIEELVKDADEIGARISKTYEIIVVDDGSTDNTLSVLRELERKCKRLSVIHHPVNLGYGGALRSGFKNAKYRYIFYTDGDGQYDPRELPKLVARMKASVGMVNGKKLKRDDSWYRRLVGGLYARATRFIFQLPIDDPDCDFRLIRKGVVDNLPLTFNSGAICLELVVGVALRGCVIEEVEVSHLPRKYGRSQFFRFRRISHTLIDLVKLWFRVARKIYFRSHTS